MNSPKSFCPQNLYLEIFGDKWSLLIIRDIMFDNKRYFREFLQSKEKIASNILSNRLKLLEEEGILYKESDSSHKQKIRYSLTKKGIDVFPILIENARWSLKYKPVDKDDAIKAQNIIAGGQVKIQAMMNELKAIHLPI